MKAIIETHFENLDSQEFVYRPSWLSFLLPELTNKQSDAEQKKKMFTTFLESNPLEVLQKLSSWRSLLSDSSGKRKVFQVYSDLIFTILNLTSERIEMESYLIGNDGFGICLKELEILISSSESPASGQNSNNVISYMLTILLNVSGDEKSCLQIRKKNSVELIQLMRSLLGKMYIFFQYM